MKNKHWIAAAAFCVIAAAEFCISILYVWKVYLPYEMNSDAACDAVYARMLADEGRLFSADWLPGSELRVVHADMIMMLLFRFTHNYYAVLLLTSASGFMIMFSAVLLFMKRCGGTFSQSVFAGIIMLLPFCFHTSSYTVLTFFYLTYYVMALTVSGLMIKLAAKDRGGVFTRRNCLSLWAVSFLAGLSGIRMMMLLTAPLVLMLLFYHIRHSGWSRKDAVSGVSIAALLAGYLVFDRVLRVRYGGGFAIESAVNDWKTIAQNLGSSLHMAVYALNLGNGQNHSGVFRGMLLLFYITAAASVIRGLRYQDRRVRALFLYASCTVAVTYISMLLFLNHPAFLDGARYLSLSMYLFFPCFVFSLAVGKSREENAVKLSCIIRIIPLLLIAVCMSETSVKLSDSERNNPRNGYLGFLEQNGYSYGLSSWWNAYITEFYTYNRVEIYPVGMPGLNPAWTLVRQSHWGRKPEFLLMTVSESREREEQGIKDDIIYSDDNYVIADFRKM